MATLISKATGNLTASTTFALTETGTGALQMGRCQNYQSNAIAPGQAATSDAFTITNGSVIDGALLWIKWYQPPVTGTMRLDLNKGGVTQASVTVNKADIPDVNTSYWVPTFFKFTTTVTGDGSATWTLVLTDVSGTGNLQWMYFNSGTNWTRALRTAVTAAPAAGDDLFVVGELTGAGTHNAITVTMNSDGSLTYGSNVQFNPNTSVVSSGVWISSWGTLAYPTTPSINSILRVAGDVWVFQNGTLSIGSVGAEIPPSSTALLEIKQINGDGNFTMYFGEGSTGNFVGSPRTAGKNVVKCKLTADVTYSNVLNTSSGYGNINSSSPQNAFDPTGTSAGYMWSLSDNNTSGNHGYQWPGPTVANQVQTAAIWIARGTGTNNRYVRLVVGNANTPTAVTNGFYADFDLQAVTAGTCSAVGNGTGTSASITPCGIGYELRITGIASTASTQVWFMPSACAGPGVSSYVGDGTQNWTWVFPGVLTNLPSISDTVFHVDTDTGWLAGDTIMVASTTQDSNGCRLYPLTANATSNTLTTARYPYNIHNGTSPIQAEVGLVTRNVKVRSGSYLTNQQWATTIYGTWLSTITAKFAEFAYLGYVNYMFSQKRGIELDGTNVGNNVPPNPKNFTYCSLHDYKDNLFRVNANNSANLVFSNNTAWNCTGYQQGLGLPTVVMDDWVCDNNLFMKVSCMYASDAGCIFTNNTSVGGGYGGAMNFTDSGVKKITGSWDNNTVHSTTNGGGIGISGTIIGEMRNPVAWRCASGSGIAISGAMSGFTLVNVLSFGNNGYQIYNLVSSADVLNIRGGVISGDIGYPTTSYGTYGIVITNNGYNILNLNNIDMSGVGGNGLFTQHQTCDLSLGSGNTHGTITNCKFGALQPVSPYFNMGLGSALGFMNDNSTIGNDHTETLQGSLALDVANYHGAAPSMKMTPISSFLKLETAPVTRGMLVAVNNGQTATVSTWVRKDLTYMGAQPRLVMRANSSVGVDVDAVLATASGTASTPLNATWCNFAPYMALSNNNLTAVNTGNQNVDTGARVDTSVGTKITGKYYFEVKFNTVVGWVGTIGIAPPTTTIGTVSSNAGGNAAGYTNNGWVYVNGQNITSGFAGATAGLIVCFAVDLDNRFIWVKTGIASNWNNSGTANPATVIGGIAIPAGPMAPIIAHYYSGLGIGTSTTANFGATAFAGPVPSGYTSGWLLATGTTGTGSWLQLTGTTPVAHADGAFEFIADCDGVSGFINVDDWTASTATVGYAPINNMLPVVTGASYLGQVLTTTNGSWIGSPTPTYAVQWMRNGTAISGATSSTYTLVSADVGTTITSRITATNSVGSINATSANVGPIAGAFSPAALPGIIGWWDFSVAASLTLSGANVLSVADQSGAGNTMNWNNGQPTYNATGLNGKPCINVNGSQALAATPFPMGYGNTLTCFWVGTLGGTFSNGRYISYAAAGAGHDYDNAASWMVHRSGGGNTQLMFYRNSVGFTGTTTVDPAIHRFIGTITSAGVMTLYIDGVQAAQGTSGGNWGSNGTMAIGRNPLTSEFVIAPFGEVGVATGYSDVTMVANLDTYLKTKWGL